MEPSCRYGIQHGNKGFSGVRVRVLSLVYWCEVECYGEKEKVTQALGFGVDLAGKFVWGRQSTSLWEMAQRVPHGYKTCCIHRPCVVITFGDLAKQVPKSYNTLCTTSPWVYKLGELAALPLGVYLCHIGSLHPSLLFS
ncbi:hypothetical protein Tco_1104415 [Tanacetum coccineum]